VGRLMEGGSIQNPPILRTRRLSAGYDSVPVLHDVNLEVRSGEVVALLGPNGAGKSTALLAVCGDLPPLGGVVEFEGVAVTSPLHKRCRLGVAFVTEDRCIFPSLTTSENLRLGRGGVAGGIAAIPELEPLLRRRAGLLSGGEQQMLAVARALAAKPKLLVIDELSLGLAPMIVERMLQTLRAAADDGVAVLLVEQYARRALRIADRAYVLIRGQVALSGSGAEMRARIAEIETSYLSVNLDSA
jgi:branched-chain amino acid transport system ATP-binding protein